MTIGKAVGGALIFVCLAGCSSKIERSYRIDVVVDTPQGPRTGHSVVRFRTSPSLDRTRGDRHPEVKGEATPIQISQGRYIFLLVDRPGRGWEIYAPWVSDKNMSGLERGSTVPIDRRYIPGFAEFEDMSDPRSVKEFIFDSVNAESSGYYLRSITIHKSNESVSDKLSSILPWLNKDHSLEGNINTIKDSSKINRNHEMKNSDWFKYSITYDAFKRGK